MGKRQSPDLQLHPSITAFETEDEERAKRELTRLPNGRDTDHDRWLKSADVAKAVTDRKVGEGLDVTVAHAGADEHEAPARRAGRKRQNGAGWKDERARRARRNL